VPGEPTDPGPGRTDGNDTARAQSAAASPPALTPAEEEPDPDPGPSRPDRARRGEILARAFNLPRFLVGRQMRSAPKYRCEITAADATASSSKGSHTASAAPECGNALHRSTSG